MWFTINAFMWQIWNTSFPLAECLLILSELPKLTLPTKTRFYYFLLLLAVEKKIQLLEDEKDFILGYLPSKEMLIKLSVQNITVDASTQNNPAWLSVFIRFHSMFFSSCSGKQNKTKTMQREPTTKKAFRWKCALEDTRKQLTWNESFSGYF